MRFLKKVFAAANLVAEIGGVASLLGMIVAVTIQVYARFFLDTAPHWTEEMARFFFVYMIAFGIGVAVRKDALVRLDMWSEYSDTKAYRIIQTAFTIGIVVFSLYFTFISWQFAQSGSYEKSPSLGFSMTFAFASLTIMMFATALFSVEKALRAFAKGEPQ